MIRSGAEALPQGWKVELLDSVARRGSGHTPDKDIPAYWNGGIKWVSLADSARLDQGLISATDKEISELGIRNSSAVMHPAGTVIVSRDAGVGKSAVLGSPMAVSQHFIAWDCSHSNRLHNWFLYYLLQYWKPELERIAVGSTIKTIGLPFFKRLKVPCPPLSEQVQIAEQLMTWDNAIVNTERLLSNSREHKQILMRLLLSGKRSVRSTEDRWSHVDLDEFFDRVTHKNAENNTNVLTISGQYGLINQREFFSKNVASDNLATYTVLGRGEFAYNRSYSAGYPMGAIKPLERYDAGVVSSLYICFRLRQPNSADYDYFRHYFEAGLLNEEIAGIAQEGARNHGLLNVSVVDFFKLRLHVPPPDERREIADILNVAEAEERSWGEQLERLRREKRALMSALLTGKRRVCLPATVETAA